MMKRCSHCGKEKPASEFVGKRKATTKQCAKCRARIAETCAAHRERCARHSQLVRLRGKARDVLRQSIVDDIADRLRADGIELATGLSLLFAVRAALEAMPPEIARRYVLSMDDAAQIGYDSYEPTPMPPLPFAPGSPEKLEAMRARLERGEAALSEDEMPPIEHTPLRGPTFDCGGLARQRGRHRVKPVAQENRG